jgi:hypothetical protein
LQIGVSELILGVSISLGHRTLSACPSYDRNGNLMVGVEELIAAVNNALQGCPGGPTPTASSTSPPPTGASTATVTPTVTWTPAPGPRIVFFGVTSAENRLRDPTITTPVPVYELPFGSGFYLVVEADGRVGGGSLTYREGGRPDLEIQATRDLGNGSTAVCDVEAPNIGGVPGIDPPQLEDPPADALNDLGCRFVDGEGFPHGRTCAEACIRFEDGEFDCKSDEARAQFCALVSAAMPFPSGDTLVTVRVRDALGAIGPPDQLIIRVTGIPISED